MDCQKERGAYLKRGNKQKTITLIIFILFSSFISVISSASSKSGKEPDLFYIAQLHYGGGGDWYEDRTSMPRLQARLEKELGIPCGTERKIVKIMDDDLFSYPMIFMTGHGNVIFTPEEVFQLQKYFKLGGFLWISDDYGMNEALTRELEKVFPGQKFVELPFDHQIYQQPYKFEEGLPKIHEHAGGTPQGYALYTNDKISVFFDFNTDIGDGLEAPEIHGDPQDVREKAFQMALNIAFFALTQ